MKPMSPITPQRSGAQQRTGLTPLPGAKATREGGDAKPPTKVPLPEGVDRGRFTPYGLLHPVLFEPAQDVGHLGNELAGLGRDAVAGLGDAHHGGVHAL